MANVLVENATLQSIADAIRNKTGKTETMLPAEMPAEIESITTGGDYYEQGYEDGKNSVPQFDRYIKENPKFTSLNMFTTSEAVLNLDNATSLSQLFNTSDETNENKIVEHLTINAPNAITAVNQMVVCTTNDTILKHLTLNIVFDNCTRFNNMLTRLQRLETIDGTPINLSVATTILNMFSYCSTLKEVRFVANSIFLSINFQWTNYLSAETIQSIIDGLADLTGGTAQTLTFHADVVLKLTDAQFTQIYDKGWNIL